MSIMDKDVAKKAYKTLCESRYFQMKMIEKGLGAYYDIGEEAITVGTLFALDKDDKVCTYFRGEALTLRYKANIPLKEMMAWWMGKESEGHPKTNVVPSLWSDIEHGVIGTTSSCLGEDQDVTCGVALAQKMQKTGKIAVLIIGAGAAGKGNFHEVLNFAAIKKLPLLIVVRANGWAMSSSSADSVAAKHVADYSAAYGIPSKIVDGNNLVEVYNEVSEAAEYVRSGKGPYLVECSTYRMNPHSNHDEDDYRDPAVKEEWKKKDPVCGMEKAMLKMGIEQTEIEGIKNSVIEDVERAYEFACGLPQIDVYEVIKEHEKVVNEMWGGNKNA